MSYESTIHLITDRMRIETEGEIIKAIQKVGVYVDKDELLKALAYDRDQYRKGYEDRDKDLVRCRECKYAEVYDGYYTQVCCENGVIGGHGELWNPDDYCSYGERKGGDNE